MMGIIGKSPLYIWGSGERKNLYTYHNKVYFFMFYFTWKKHLYFYLKEIFVFIRAPPSVLHFKKYEMEDRKVSEKVKIRIKDFYNNVIGEQEYTYVSKEVYETLANSFRKEAHAEHMRDLRHRSAEGYIEGDTEDLILNYENTLEEEVILKMDLERLQIALQSLTEIQRERLQLYFFERLSTREIAERQGINQNAVWKSIQMAIKNLRNFFV